MGTPFSYEGRHITVMDSPALPEPVQDGGVPIVIGGGGPQRTPALAAPHGAEYNLPFASISRFDEQKELVAAACVDVARDPASITYTAAQVVCVGADDAEVAAGPAAIGRQPDELRRNGVAGTPDEVRARWSDGPKPAPSGCTCRCSTSPNPTTSTPSPIWSAEAGPRRAEAAEARWLRRVS